MSATANHPGEVLARKLGALGVSPTELARQLHVPANRITQIVNGKRAITGDSALRLAHWFGDEPEHWMALQARYDLEIAKTEAGREIAELPTRLRRAAPSPKSHTKPDRWRAA
jgi:antitoxin HigA-1